MTVSWVLPTKKCCVAFKSLPVQMLPVTSDQRPAILKSRSGFSSPYDIIIAGSWRPTSQRNWHSHLPSSCTHSKCWYAVTLTNCHPEIGLLHPVLWKNKVRRAETFVDSEQVGFVKPILKGGLHTSRQLTLLLKRCGLWALVGTDTVKVASGPLLYNPSRLYNLGSCFFLPWFISIETRIEDHNSS